MTRMQPIRRVCGTALPLTGDDIDTDQIMPSRFLRWITFAGLEEHVFADVRQAGAHPFDDPIYKSASILIAERNFGCGSSREHAPQGLRRRGFEAIVAESFGEIFAANCAAIGIVCMNVSRPDREWLSVLIANYPEMALVVDIDQQQVEAASRTLACTLPQGRRQQLLDGSWDALSLLLSDPLSIDSMAARSQGLVQAASLPKDHAKN